ncbi:hypothetical protein BT96DRAFT_1011521 [Gymnopus androsaceus JB14]|uniref:SAGA-associated factor 11 n=1 Tax=Gymnopus androsaceus JB14 TaxID=1447944 RepID=A0A6A4ILP7_9AGAR|nr:hypothetical protein BT96DRAFT_1011521 [Gymnopus androsaceus JB14]
MAPSKAEKAEKEQVLQALTTKLFCDLLDDFVMDVTLEAHAEVSRSRAICETCGTRCNAEHVPASARALASSSRAGTPLAGTSTPTAKGDGAINLECVNCQRMVASNRYAPHLSDCMGLNTSRRGGARTKTKLPSDAGRDGSPASEAGYESDGDKSPVKSKGKSKTKRAEEAEFNLKRKRPISPQVSPSKKQKQKGSPISRVKSDNGLSSGMSSLPSSTSQSKIPSKLRDSSTAPFNDKGSTGSSRESSPDASLSSTLSSSFKNQGMASRPKSVPLKQPSQPRPPPPVPAYIEDDEGEETGSSTDTN